MGQGDAISFLPGVLPCLALAQNAELEQGLYYKLERDIFQYFIYVVEYFYLISLTETRKTFVSWTLYM